MSFAIIFKNDVIFEEKGNHKCVKIIFPLLPKYIRTKIIKHGIEQFHIENYDFCLTKQELKDVKLVKSDPRAKRNKKYYDKIKKEKIQCECGSVVLKVTYKRHLESKKHKEKCGFYSCEE
jgi:hypothetical protein